MAGEHLTWSLLYAVRFSVLNREESIKFSFTSKDMMEFPGGLELKK